MARCILSGLVAGLLGTVPTPTAAQDPDLPALAAAIGGRGSAFERTTRLVHWINDSLSWSATDYVNRTPQEILARRQGNCAALASVLHVMLQSLEIRSRWIREINLQPAPTPRRQRTADSLVQARGASFSVFGLQHNDHVWLEVWDEDRQEWFPADPAYGVVGLAQWLPARLALADRPRPRVDAVVPIAADMLAPFVVLAQTRRNSTFEADRTEFYLIDRFATLYQGRLADLPAWPAWVAAVRDLSAEARGAFEGRSNLHAHTDRIARLKQTYDDLIRQAGERGLRWR